MEAVVQLEREIAGLYHGGAGQHALPDALRKMKRDLDDELEIREFLSKSRELGAAVE